MGLRQGRRRRLGAVPGLLTALVVVSTSMAWAPAPLAMALASTTLPAVAPAANLSVAAGDAGNFIPGRPAPVRVEIRSDRLIAGQLVVTAGPFQIAQPVEVAGGSSKQFEVVVPTVNGQSQLQAEVSLTEGRTVVVSGGSTATAAPDTEVVGVMPELLVGRTLPGPAPLSVDLGTARFVAVSDQDLALAPGTFGPLSAVALGPDGLTRLSPEARQGLLAWTAGGGRLLIDANPGDGVAGLPLGWQTAGSARASAGVGQVVLTSGAMAAGKWAGLVDPAGHGSGAANNVGFNSTAPLSSALASDAGLKTPRLPWLVAFLVLYIALAGPVSFFVLRRRRRPELLWVVIPVVALMFAGSGYAIGGAARSRVRVVHGTVVDTTVAGGTAVSFLGVLSGGQGTTRLDAPRGWVLQRYYDPQNPPPPANFIGLKAAATSHGVAGDISLDAGQFAVVRADGPAGFSGQLAVTAASTVDGRAEGTVVNRTGYPLQDVSVLVGGAGADVGSLAPGAQASWSVSTGSGNNPGISVENQLWPNSFGGIQSCVGPIGPGFVGPGGFKGCGGSPASPGSSGSAASLPVWSAGPVGLAPGTRSSGGVAVAVGWTHGYKPPVTVAGHGRPAQGRTAIVGTAPVAPVPPAGELAIWRQVIRGSLTQVGPGMFVDTTNSGQRIAVTWTLPPSATGHRVSLAIPGGAGEVDVWSDHTWRKLTDNANGASGAAGSAGSANSGPFVGIPPVTFVAPNIVPIPFPTPATSSPAPGAIAPATVPPKFGFAPAFPTTAPVPFGPQGFGSTVVTTATLGPADVDNGAIYVRLGGGSFNQPFNLDSLALTVLP